MNNTWGDIPKKRDASVILLHDDGGRILLQHREKERKISPNCWAFFGGGIEAGETPDQALQRESMEELEWRVKNPVKLFALDLEPWGYETILYVYAEHCADASMLVLHEGQDWGWFRNQDVSNLLMTPWDRVLFERAYPMIFPR